MRLNGENGGSETVASLEAKANVSRMNKNEHKSPILSVFFEEITEMVYEN